MTLSEAVVEINAAATAVDSTLSSVASLGDSNTIVLTTPTSGNLADFGGSIRVTGTFSPNSVAIFTDTALKEGTGSIVNSIDITAASPGSWANDVVSVQFSDENALFYAPNSSRMDVLVNGSIVETYREVVLDPEADGTQGTSGEGTFIESAVNGISEYVNVDFDDDLTDLDGDTFTTSTKIVANTSSTGSNPPYELDNGADGINGLSDADIIGVAADSVTGEPTGLQTFANTETIFINLLAAPGWSSQAVGNELVSIAESRADTLAVLDPPLGLTPTQVVDWHNGQGSHGRTAALNNSYAAVYGTWIQQFDPYNNVNVNVPPSAQILAQFAFSDNVSEPWFATAGLNRGRLTNALDVVNNPTLGQRELMYGNGNAVNPIVNFVQDGIVIWGQRTTQRTASALDRINVRRLLNYTKTVIGLGAKVILFEPNDSRTITRLINIVNPVLQDIKNRRGITEFKVEDATTDRDRNLNRIVLRVFIRPTKAAEVIDIPFIITADGGSFAI
jgi:phage tail sheath protein FI